jgi:Branched-chain amino acid transport protein (AzlD)
MNTDVLILALMAGAANWAFRFLPTKVDLAAMSADGWLARFLAATGPAAICTLFVASILPAMMTLPKDGGAILSGVVATCAMFAVSRSIAGATIAGAVAYGMVVWIVT